jgi:hypothetical protein
MNLKSFREKLTNWELWPFFLRYILITPVWLWYCIRSGSLWFFTPSNPGITFGGFEGEGKKEMYDQLPEGSYPKTIYVRPGEDFEPLKQRISAHGFSYPFIVKPDVGMKGLLFRKIDNEKELQTYHSLMPFEYIVQDLVLYPLEVSVFYYRHPAGQQGVISGFIQKELMDVTGNGRQSLWELIEAHPKAKHRLAEMRIKHEEYLEHIVPAGERYILTYAANLNRGAQFTNLEKHIDAELLKVFDDLSHHTGFFYGRYDLKCLSVEDLKKGKNFVILEFNGSGAEPNHVYHSGYSLLKANRVFLRHWKALYRISKYNHRQGHRYWPLMKGWDFLRQAKKHLAELEKFDKQIPV